MKLGEIVKGLMAELQLTLRKSLRDQGHFLTGDLSESIEFEITENAHSATGIMFFADYGVYVEAGVTADKIPFGGKSRGGGGTSKYIRGLVTFWEGRGLSGREALSAAFATAKVHKRDGMPSRGSYQYSKTGERLGFVRIALENETEKIQRAISENFATEISLTIGQAISNDQYTKVFQ